ncbi:FtsP/CotA-like multicopper oxidase with cupredoxin domain [Microvirga flocculans]|uniref:FtsP/CotA-like multicopper oxidase with cupredoxin domain n=1 Tax=Microvirga flocculans TaxID=217168 RepID=A0A7W6IGB3_9HYPH|nr:multicopper oxidase family protein [Microvirga flocculans]MBB4040986.1 FtsP/CotA-like multicopper oxidase with cupredoxin domain [Microvirga flocculans]
MITRRAVAAGLATTLIGLPRTGQAQDSLGSEFLLTAKPARLKLRPDAPGTAEVWTLGDSLSPVLRARPGQELRMTLRNETSRPLSLHVHGMRGPNAADGVGGLTQAPVFPGQSHESRFVPPDSGTFLLRPCILGGSAEPLERGLSGLLIVEEPRAPEVDRDLALLMDDWRLAEDGTLAPFERPSEPAPAGRLGNWLSVNGGPTPQRIEAPPGGRLRLRLANACNARAMRLRFDGLKAYVIAVDGQPTSSFEPLRASLPFAPGTRYDLLADIPAEAGARGAVMALIGDGMPLVEIVATGSARPALPPVAPLPPNPKLPDAIKLQNAARKDLVIKGDPQSPTVPWTINGAAGNASGPPLLKVRRGSPVVLTLTNQTAFMQPLHLHGHCFRLLHALDDGWEPYFLDTVQVPENRTIRIAFVADNPGKWLLASTVMERFDAGLWTWIEVT